MRMCKLIRNFFFICILAGIAGFNAHAQSRYASVTDSIAESKVREIPFVKLLLDDDAYKGEHVRYRYEPHTIVKIWERPIEPGGHYVIWVTDMGHKRDNLIYVFTVDPKNWKVTQRGPIKELTEILGPY